MTATPELWKQEIATARANGTAHEARLLPIWELLAEWQASELLFADAVETWRQLAECLESAPGVALIDRAVTMVRLADMAWELGQFADADAGLDTAIRLIESEPPVPILDLAQIYNIRAELALEAGWWKQSVAWSRKSVALMDGVIPASHPELIRAFNNLGAINLIEGDLAMAERLFRRNLKAFRQSPSASDPAQIPALQRLAELCQLQGRLIEAEKLTTRALALCTVAFGDRHELTADALLKQADHLTQRGCLTEAERQLRRALDLHRLLFPGHHPRVAETLRLLGDVLIERGKPADAEPLLDEAVQSLTRVFGSNDTRTMRARAELARVYFELGRVANAERIAKECLITFERQPAGTDSDLAPVLRLLAEIQRLRGDSQAALQHAEMAMRHLDRPHVPRRERVPSLLLVVELLFDRGRLTDGAVLLKRAVSLCASDTLAPLPSWVDCQQLRARLALMEGHVPAASRRATRAYQGFARLADHPPRKAAALAAVLADCALATQDWHEANVMANEEVRFREKLSSSDQAALSRALVRVADASQGLMDYVTAEAALKRALSISERIPGIRSSAVSEIVERIARLHLLRGDFEAFRPWMQRALQFLHDAPDEIDTSRCSEFVNLLQTAGQVDTARQLAQDLDELRDRNAHVLFELL